MLALVESVAVSRQSSVCSVQVAAWLQTGSGGGEVSPGLINIIRGESCHDKLNSIYPGTLVPRTFKIELFNYQLHIHHMN